MRFPSVPEGQGDTGSTGGHIPVRGDATLLSSHVGRPCYVRRAAQRTVATKAINFVERTRRTPGFWTLGDFVGEHGVTSTAWGRGLEKITHEHADCSDARSG